MRTVHVRLDRILMPPPVTAGMNYLVIASLTYMLRSTTDDAPPVVLARAGKHYRIVDGRHRFVAHHIAGRQRILARIQDTPPAPTPTKPR